MKGISRIQRHNANGIGFDPGSRHERVLYKNGRDKVRSREQVKKAPVTKVLNEGFEPGSR